MSRLFAIIRAHERKWGVRPAALARKVGTPPQTFTNWKKGAVKKMPGGPLLSALSAETGVDYRDVVDAALTDTGYIPKPPRLQPPARRPRQVKLQSAPTSPTEHPDTPPGRQPRRPSSKE